MGGFGFGFGSTAGGRQNFGSQPSALEVTSYGALSRNAEGAGIETGASAILAGDPNRHWQITDGMLHPTAAGDAAELNAGPYLLTLDSENRLISIIADSWDVSTDEEWAAIMAQPAETLAGKTVRIRGNSISSVVIDDRDMTAHSAKMVITAVDSEASLEAVNLLGTTRGIQFVGMKFQMLGWPCNQPSLVSFGTGTFGTIEFIGCKFRHGYGPQLVDFDTSAQLPEYARVDHIRTATSSSQTYQLDWLDPAAAGGIIEFFNRGSETVHVAVGDADVRAGLGDLAVPSGGYCRIKNLVPERDTCFAIVTAAGSTEVNARAEIGLHNYMASGFFTTGSADIEDIAIVDCKFRDLNNAAKGLGAPQDALIMDNDFYRIYGDLISLSSVPGGQTRILRNLECIPAARSGIREDLNGDAGDPHGDIVQMFGNGTGTIENVFYAGNRARVGALRPDVISQSLFLSDNDCDPSYGDVYVISSTHIGGNSNALNAGEEDFPIRNFMVYGATVLNHRDVTDITPSVRLMCEDAGMAYVGQSIAPRFVAQSIDFERDGNLALGDISDPASIFPNLTDLASARTRQEIDTALATSGLGSGLGASATVDAIDWSTSDPDAVIRWENIPSGAHWNTVEELETATLTQLPLRKILNRRPSQPVVPEPGTEWCSVDVDGVTQVQPWTAGEGTIEPGQSIQIRRMSSANPTDAVVAGIAINGFMQSVRLKTKMAQPVNYLVTGTSPGYFVDPVKVPGNTSRITFRGKFNFPEITNTMKPFLQVSTACDLQGRADGSAIVTVEDGTGAPVIVNEEVLPAGSLQPGIWLDLTFDVDHVAAEIRITVNTQTTVMPFTVPGNGVFQSNRQVAFLANSSGGNAIPQGTKVADLSVDFNGVRHKSIANDPATANVDLWHEGAALQGSP
ncbi:MAG: hypothetical protein WA957_09620 [Alteraurantiacibacter sp.]